MLEESSTTTSMARENRRHHLLLSLISIESKQNEADPTGDAADARTVEPAEIDNYSRYYTRIQDRPL